MVSFSVVDVGVDVVDVVDVDIVRVYVDVVVCGGLNEVLDDVDVIVIVVVCVDGDDDRMVDDVVDDVDVDVVDGDVAVHVGVHACVYVGVDVDPLGVGVVGVDFVVNVRVDSFCWCCC